MSGFSSSAIPPRLMMPLRVKSTRTHDCLHDQTPFSALQKEILCPQLIAAQQVPYGARSRRCRAGAAAVGVGREPRQVTPRHVRRTLHPPRASRAPRLRRAQATTAAAPPPAPHQGLRREGRRAAAALPQPPVSDSVRPLVESGVSALNRCILQFKRVRANGSTCHLIGYILS